MLINPVTTVPAPAATLAIQSAMSGVTDAAIGRLPVTIVPGAVGASRGDNNLKNPKTLTNRDITQASGLTTNPAANSAFLAQLLTDDAETGIVLPYETLIAFSNVKYLPGNAAGPAVVSPTDRYNYIISQLNSDPTLSLLNILDTETMPESAVPLPVSLTPLDNSTPVTMFETEDSAIPLPVVSLPIATYTETAKPVGEVQENTRVNITL